ncbi:MAG TPA: ATP-binding protein [Bacteroidales bacterium]|nr:ATP-binding protein [Bacteroidales bacterium]HQB56414.1 ATP-binding protein [Bacteroidales bacterium]
MILELKVKNFLSFRDEVTFSFEATRDTSFEDYQVVKVAPNTRILRLAIVYGANASGKSNLLRVFDFLRDFWFKIREDKDESTGVIPFLLDEETPQEPSEISLIFYTDGIKHLYSLVLDKKKVISEKLFIYPGTQPALIFERRLNGNISEIIFNPKRTNISQPEKDEITVKCLLNMSLLAAYNRVNISVPEIDNVIQWMKNQYTPPIEPDTRLVSFAEEMIAKNASIKKHILNFLRRADYNITNINTEEIEENIPDHILSVFLKRKDDLPDDEKEMLKTIKFTKTDFEHKIINKEGASKFYSMPKGLQSAGTLRTFGLASAISQVVDNNAFLAIDEIESSLHPRLVEFIIEDFFKQKGQSQLLLTTHYDGLLEEDDLLRKDSIWFTNKKENGATELYSLADFKGVNRISSWQKAYKYGKFGAIPNI